MSFQVGFLFIEATNFRSKDQNSNRNVQAVTGLGGRANLKEAYFAKRVSNICKSPMKKPKAAPMISTKRNSLVRIWFNISSSL
jgi:hypothetical protein